MDQVTTGKIFLPERSKTGKIKRVDKGWGYELWLANKPQYCGKLLFIKKGKNTSWHYHAIKDETMFVQSGMVEILYSWDNDIEKASSIVLNKGDSMHIPVNLKHRIIALENTELFEFSMEHFDSDSIRLIKGD